MKQTSGSWVLPPGRVLAGLALCAAACVARAELPNEQLTVAQLPKDATHRVYLSDPAMNHLVDGRMHVIDGAGMRYLGMLGTGFVAQTCLSRDRSEIYVATTYHSRLQRGTRTDVVEVYGTDDLQFRHEIEIPPKHAQALPIRASLATTSDGRFLLVQNATPASSVTVVDLKQRKVVGEVPTPGCWGALPWPGQPRRFSTVCGDGTLATIELDEAGIAMPRSPGTRFFDADKDPVFMHYEFIGEQLHLLSYGGQVHTLSLRAEGVTAEPAWSFIPPADFRKGWRPGGYQLFTVDAVRQRLFVGMHPGAHEGSHKTPAAEIWVVDLKERKRVSRSPGRNAVAMTLSHGANARLFVLDGMTNGLVALDPQAMKPGKPLGRFDGIGDTPILLEAH